MKRPIPRFVAVYERNLLHQLLEEAFFIDSSGALHYNFREDTAISEELAKRLKQVIRKSALGCQDYETKTNL